MTSNRVFKSFRIALVTSSIRQPRLNPYITADVHQALTNLKISPILPDNNHNNISLEIVDIAEQGLPLHDEPVVPSLHPAYNPAPHYIHAHTRAPGLSKSANSTPSSSSPRSTTRPYRPV
ncbi:hypothetical protein MPDQ_003158 [Monascus purpureus]|uniref:NADPH-dependent FMN reductase-like domain-containing protein n=1 Tax=Monascus purpureus TaxID=5098 RepID=A0A507QNA9_MONPU|nr:hypothetical protein MPDQ_003158 [Monascus purpureus]BDD61365.1 hypothetical protein MAP00_006412 [Monascus purpureus]